MEVNVEQGEERDVGNKIVDATQLDLWVKNSVVPIGCANVPSLGFVSKSSSSYHHCHTTVSL